MVDDQAHGPSVSQSGTRRGALYNRPSPRSPGEAIKPTMAPPPPLRSSVRRRRDGLWPAFSAFLIVLLILFTAVGSAVYFGHREFYARGPLRETRILTVKGGNQTVAETLQREGVIDQALVFVIGLHVLGANDSIKAGEYAFKAGSSMKDVMDILVEGKSVLHPVTIPEGLTSEQVLAKLLANDLLNGEITAPPAEGSLLPETYMVPRGTSRQSVIDRMTAEHHKVLAQAWEMRAPNLPLKSPSELVILASIVEKETGKPDERARVAAVFVNRLRQGMKLQSDPTIVYGIVGGKGTLGRGIRKSEISEGTPYNTYVINGLPPGPIANPGRASLFAAAKPAVVDDLFFVADGTGGHQFAKSLDDHNRNVRAWRKIEASRNLQDNIDRLETDENAALEPSNKELVSGAQDGAKKVVKALDASEGTKLDPLKNKTYDLTSPKTVPKLGNVK